MNTKDLEILSHLRHDARVSLTKMSRETNIPVSTIFDKLHAFEKKYILRHTSLVDFKKLGYMIRSHISIKSNKDNRESLVKFLTKNNSVNSLYKINNGFDFMFEGIFIDIQEMENFIEMLEEDYNIIDHKEHFVIEDIKRESFLAEPSVFYDKQ